MRLSWGCFVIAVAALQAACSSVPHASRAEDQQAKQFTVGKDSAVLYIVQNGGYASGMALFQISVDGQPQGSLSGWTYHRVEVVPGTHTVVASSPENEGGVRVNASAGKVVFISVPSSAGWKFMRVGDMKELDAATGREAVLNADLAMGYR